jgi:hypothetical protein
MALQNYAAPQNIATAHLRSTSRFSQAETICRQERSGIPQPSAFTMMQ